MKAFFLSTLFLMCSLLSFSQGKQLQGRIVESDTKKPLAGATISIVGKNASAVSEADGSFNIKVNGKTILVVSYVGYKTQSVDVTDKSSVEIALAKDVSDLEAVVTIGYGKAKKKDITSAISSISGKDIKDQPVTTVAAALQGRVPGMQVSGGGNEPGAGTSVKIRGINSITQGSGPLYVVDGVLITGDIREINPNDIESIDVLKDASAAAIYGSRASEGVVIITTKKGATGRSSLNYDGYFGMQKLYNGKGYDFVDNIDDYVKIRMAGWADEDPKAWSPDSASTMAKIFSAPELQSIKDRKWYNWEKAVTQVAPMQSHTLSYSNGVGKNKFYLSGNYLNQDGIIKGSNFLRYSVKANVESEATANLKIGINTNFSHIVNNVVSNEVYYNAVTMSPLWPIYDGNGDPSVLLTNDGSQVSVNNPLTMTKSPMADIQDRNIMNVFGEYKIVKNLLFRSNFGIDILRQQKFEYYPRTTSYGFQVGGDAKVQNWGYRDYVWDNTLTYDWQPRKDHVFNLMGGVVLEKRRQEWDYIEAQGFPSDDLTYKNLATASNKTDIQSDYFNRMNFSQMARAIYKYKGKYILNGSIRHDGSSRFGQNNTYGTFPAISGAWRLIDEPFMGAKIRSIISDAKIRVGYGIVGNQNLPDFAKFNKMTPSSYPYNGSSQTTGYQLDPSVLGNPNIRWEKQKQFNAGFDLALLASSRIKLTFDYYNKNIDDVLLPVPLSPSMGVGYEYMNIARMNTQGVDLGLKLSLVQNKNFDWQMDLNWSKYKSQVKSLIPGRDSLSPYLKVGEAPNSLIVDYVYDGLYQESDKGSPIMASQHARPGDVKPKDLNNDGVINQYDRTIVGRTTPKAYGGIWNYLRYKRFSMTVLASYTYGQDIANKAYQDYLYETDTRRRVLKEGLNYWTPTNTNTNVPRPNVFSRSIYTLPSGSSSYIVQRADFIRVRNITFSYDFDQALLSKARMNTAKVYVQVQDPFIITKYKGIDPEIGVGSMDVYPRYRSFLVGLQLGL
ncbi:TonB-dependent receptor [Chitinophagaceae bacterium 26-R-25]|nr:TonB-dependent receptor [Chitinophagaceae bacterium 26-R-25]